MRRQNPCYQEMVRINDRYMRAVNVPSSGLRAPCRASPMLYTANAPSMVMRRDMRMKDRAYRPFVQPTAITSLLAHSSVQHIVSSSSMRRRGWEILTARTAASAHDTSRVMRNHHHISAQRDCLVRQGCREGTGQHIWTQSRPRMSQRGDPICEGLRSWVLKAGTYMSVKHSLF